MAHVANNQATVSKGQLRTMIFADPQPFDESKRGTEPGNSSPRVWVDENGNNDSGWDGAVFSHARSARESRG
jgi:hypothetical protein